MDRKEAKRQQNVIHNVLFLVTAVIYITTPNSNLEIHKSIDDLIAESRVVKPFNFFLADSCQLGYSGSVHTLF